MTDLDRRRFLKTSTALSLAGAGFSALEASAAGAQRKRKFTMDLSCGMIGVRADGREAIRLARQYGFESVAPDAGFLARLSEDQLQELLAEMKAKKLMWGAAGLAVDFRGDESRFTAGVKRLPQQAAVLKRAGVTRVGTWLSPAPR